MTKRQAVAALSLGLFGAAAHAIPTYSVVRIGMLPGAWNSQSTGINDANQVVGNSGFATSAHAILFDGNLVDIHPPSEVGTSAAAGINDSGLVALTATFNAYRYQSGVFTKLFASGGKPLSFATAVSNSGLVCGVGLSQTLPPVATVWSPLFTVGNEIGFLPGAMASNAYGINDFGDIVGDCRFGATSVAAYFSAGWFVAGGTSLPGTLNSVAKNRVAVGWIDGPDKQAIIVDLPTNQRTVVPNGPTFRASQAFGVNQQMTVVGTGNILSGEPRGFVWTQADGMHEIDDLLAPGDKGEYSIVDAHAINSAGCIAATANQNGADVAVLLVPNTVEVPPDSTTFNLGNVSHGDASSLGGVDGNTLDVCKGFVPNFSVPPVQVTFEATSPDPDPTMIQVSTVSRTSVAGSFNQTLQLWNWTSNQFEDSLVAPIGIAEKTLSLYATATPSSPLGRYVQAGTRRVRGKYSVKSTGFVASFAWCAKHDLAECRVNP